MWRTPKLLASSLEGSADVTRTVVRHDPLNLHAQGLIEDQRLAQELDAVQARLVGFDRGEGHARMVVDGQVYRVPTNAMVTVLALSCDAVAN